MLSFLQNARRPDQSSGEVFETGLALDALLALRADRLALAPVAAALAARQSPDRSFSNDAYVTAIALRALWQYEQPDVGPTPAGITGRVLSADTELPIAGAQLVMSGAPSASNGNRHTSTHNLMSQGVRLLPEGVPPVFTITPPKHCYRSKSHLSPC